MKEVFDAHSPCPFFATFNPYPPRFLFGWLIHTYPGTRVLRINVYVHMYNVYATAGYNVVNSAEKKTKRRKKVLYCMTWKCLLYFLPGISSKLLRGKRISFHRFESSECQWHRTLRSGRVKQARLFLEKKVMYIFYCKICRIRTRDHCTDSALFYSQ